MNSVNLDQYIKSVTDNYLNAKTASCVDVRHNNRLFLFVIAMLAVIILLTGVFWLWNAPENQRFLIKIIVTGALILVALVLINFTFRHLYS